MSWCEQLDYQLCKQNNYLDEFQVEFYVVSHHCAYQAHGPSQTFKGHVISIIMNANKLIVNFTKRDSLVVKLPHWTSQLEYDGTSPQMLQNGYGSSGMFEDEIHGQTC